MNFQKLVGQGYDGASAMAGHVCGVQTRIRGYYPTAIFVHCASQSLNMVISDRSEGIIIGSTCVIIKGLFVFSERA